MINKGITSFKRGTISLGETLRRKFQERFDDETRKVLLRQAYVSVMVTDPDSKLTVEEEWMRLFLQYDESFSGPEIYHLYTQEIPPARANWYAGKLPPQLIPQWVRRERPENATEYPETFDEAAIHTAKKLGILPREIRSRSAFEAFMLHQENNYFVCFNRTIQSDNNVSIIGRGASGIVISGTDCAYKFSVGFTRTAIAPEENKPFMVIVHEFNMLNKIREKHGGKQKNILQLLDSTPPADWHRAGTIREGYGRSPFHDGPDQYIPDKLIKVQRIEGKSIDSILEEKNAFTADEALHYTAGILNGLCEMRVAHIYHHRDIHTRNIMIDSERDEAVIIDLGLASKKRRAAPHYNIFFGPEDSEVNNDLHNLAQVAYKMYTGNNLFRDDGAKGATRREEGRQIKANRDEAFQDLAATFRKIDDTIDTKLGKTEAALNTIIKELLTAKHYQVSRMRRRIDELREAT